MFSFIFQIMVACLCRSKEEKKKKGWSYRLFAQYTEKLPIVHTHADTICVKIFVII